MHSISSEYGLSATTPFLVSPTSHPQDTKSVRVLHLVNGEHYSGAERVQDLLAQRLSSQGFDVGFACVKPGLFPSKVRADVPIHSLEMKSRLHLQVVRRLSAMVRKDRYQLLHAHTPRTLLLGALVSRATGVPLIYHVHSPTSRDSARPIHNFLNHWTERVSLIGVRHLITVSESLKKHMVQQGVSAGKISVVPNGVPRPEQHRACQPPQAEWTLGTVALFRPRKGTEILLQAVRELRDAGRQVVLRAIGPFETDAYRLHLEETVRKLKLEEAVHWTGFRDNVNAELLKLDLFVLPSLFGEGLPMVVLESMAAGVPVVGTSVEGVPEAIRHGRDGMLAQPGNASDLAQAIGQIMDAEVSWSGLRESGMQRHAAMFSDESMARRCADVYRSVLNSSPAGV